MRYLFLFIIALLSTAGLFAQEAVILFDNDVHCSVEGYTKMAALRDQYRQQGIPTVVTSCGDFAAGATLGATSKGEYIARIMNVAHYDIVTLGNHEFDYQIPQLLRLDTLLAAQIVCCNFIDNSTRATPFASCTLRQLGSCAVAFIGVTTPSTPTTSTPTYFMDADGRMRYSFCTDSLSRHVQHIVDQVRREGAQYVVVLSHLGDGGEDYTSLDLIKNTQGIDAVLDGHSHNIIPQQHISNLIGQEVILASTGAHFQNIGLLSIAHRQLSTRLIPTDSIKDSSPAVDQVVDSIQAAYRQWSLRPIGRCEAPLISRKGSDRLSRYQQTSLGDFCADAFRKMLHTDIGFINGGGMRTNLDSGTVTYNDLYAIFPFGNQVSVVQVSGQRILNALELGVRSLDNDNGAFLQVSGLTYHIDTTVASSVKLDANGIMVGVGNTRRVHDVKVYDSRRNRWRSIRPHKLYTVASINYVLINHGNGFDFGGYSILRHNVCTDLELLEQYILQLPNATITSGQATTTTPRIIFD